MLVKFTNAPALQLPDGTVVQPGEAVEVEKGLGEQLLKQGWEPANKTKKEKS